MDRTSFNHKMGFPMRNVMKVLEWEAIILLDYSNAEGPFCFDHNTLNNHKNHFPPT